MRIVFYDRTPVDYSPETPFERALGGSESAQCYLAIELARLGHSVILVTNTSVPGRYRGVDCRNHHDPNSPALLNAADIVVASNEALGRTLRDAYRVTKPLVLWIGHAHDQPAIKDLESSRERKIWAGFAFVSQWQLEQFADAFWVPADKSRVMRNAVSPAFEKLAPAEPWFLRNDPPVLVYTSQPYRGLDVLLDAFPTIRAAIPGTRLRVFSGFAATYQTAPDDDPYKRLYERCVAMEGVDYIGPIAQTMLADEISKSAALAYPCTFMETSCIAALEAMAAGLIVLTTRTAALPETTAGYACLAEYRDDRAKLAADFSAMAVDALNAQRHDPANALAKREAQIAYVREHYTWEKRALEWQSWLSEIVRRR
jgi:glycosyltransferase involved in cell wall biosynthesis